MNPQSGPGATGASAAAPPIVTPSVLAVQWSRRAWKAGRHLLWTLWATSMASWPTKLTLEHPLLRLVLAVAAAAYLVVAVGELRVRVLLNDDGLVIVGPLRRTRIPWTDVSEVRVRGLTMGRGWVEVVRGNSREVALPTPVETYPLLKDRWERATAIGAAGHPALNARP
ncbi:PH domain-containing protein [Terrabacter carboxydivorans]